MSEYTGGERRDIKWHMDKRISLSHMISTIVLAGALVGVYQDMDNRQIRVEAEVKHIKEEARRMDVDHKREVHLLRIRSKEEIANVGASLSGINLKLDRLVEQAMERLNGK